MTAQARLVVFSFIHSRPARASIPVRFAPEVSGRLEQRVEAARVMVRRVVRACDRARIACEMSDPLLRFAVWLQT
jgi:hypothetical protein